MQNYTDTLDLRDLADEWAELVTEREDAADGEATDLDDEIAEFVALGAEFYTSITTPDELRKHGDMEDPTLINEDYFEAYAEQLAEDLGMIEQGADWPNCHIDWEAAANALRSDYTEITFRGQTYLTRG